jgi:hypothetical protein
MGLSYAMFVSMANVIDRVRCSNYDWLCCASFVEVLNCFGGWSYTGKVFVNSVKGLIGAVLRLLKVVNCTSLWFFLSVGLLSVRLVGLKIIVCCGKIVNEKSPTPCKPQN